MNKKHLCPSSVNFLQLWLQRGNTGPKLSRSGENKDIRLNGPNIEGPPSALPLCDQDGPQGGGQQSISLISVPSLGTQLVRTGLCVFHSLILAAL